MNYKIVHSDYFLVNSDVKSQGFVYLNSTHQNDSNMGTWSEK